MSRQETFFEWEDSFKTLENVMVDVYVNKKLKIPSITLNKLEIYRDDSYLLNFSFHTQQRIYSDLIKDEGKIYDLEIELKLKEPRLTIYDSITMFNTSSLCENYSYAKDNVETKFTAFKILYSSNRDEDILKEWYGCNNKLNFYNGFLTSKITEETIKYKNQNNISYVIKNRSESFNRNSFWVKLKDFRFKVYIIGASNDKKEYSRYVIEYRKKWGEIPDEDKRYDIATFLSFIIGTKLIKFGESYFNDDYITQKEYISPTAIDISLLYQTNFPFYIEDCRYNDTDNVIKQLPKMLRKYFLLKEKYRLNEALSSLYIKSYLNFNFINYVTYIEMFANIDVDKKTSLVPKAKFRKVLKELNEVKKVPQCIKDKFQNLNTIGIGKKVQRLLSQYKIDYSRYQDVFSTRGKVVHGAKVDIQEMFIASEKAKELLTILTLKKLNYVGYIRNFVNNNELILIKDMSIIHIDSTEFNQN